MIMKNSFSNDPQGSSPAAAPQPAGFSPGQWLKGRRISYLTLPLLVMATITEFVILATGWKYQQVVCLPKGMAVTFFGIGPIGATILAVELLKLPLAIWTASRQGMQKAFMLVLGLPLICLLTFQLVKDMAVYEMGVALAPASQMLTEANKQEVKIAQLNGALSSVDGKKSVREAKLAELAANKTKARAELEDALKRNEDTRQDAISLTDYQKKQLSEVDSREATIIQQFNADTEQLTKALADLRARRETEQARAAKWNAEEARIDNAYKAKMAAYTNLKTAYVKAKAEYDGANFLKRELMKEPIDPGVAPVREVNTILKPVELEALDAQIKSKETELAAVNSKRRDSVAQVEADARQLRAEFDRRSGTKREETDRKRDELLAAQAALAVQWAAEEKQINQEFGAASGKVDGIRAELDEARRQAEGFYEAREAAIKNTQVHRIATTVEIVRGLFKGQRPVSITATAKERGDLYTDQISMVRIWVYPVLAFIVAYLPTLMVEIGFSTVFQPEQQRATHRLGFLGRRLHWIEKRAGHQKILRAERMANEAATGLAARNRSLGAAQAAATKTLAEREVELQAAHEALEAAAAGHAEELQRREEAHAEQTKHQEAEWVAKLGGMADALNRAVVEKDALRDLQRSEIERQIQMRQNAWSDRLSQLTRELDEQRAAAETERTAQMQSHQKRLLEVSEEAKTQVTQARRQSADAELAAMESTAKFNHDLKDALRARDNAEAQLKQQTDTIALKLSQVKDEAARDLEKAARQEKHRLEQLQLENGKALRRREEDFEARFKQREHELTMGIDTRLAEQQTRLEQEARRREVELERQAETRSQEVEGRYKQELVQKEELHQSKFRQQDQQWQAKLDTVRAESQAETEEGNRRREADTGAGLRDLEARLRQEMQQKEEALQAKAKLREQDLTAQLNMQADARQMLARVQWETESENRSRGAIEPLKSLLVRAEKERDEARQSAMESANKLQELEKKLTEASSFLNPWRNGGSVVGAP